MSTRTASILSVTLSILLLVIFPFLSDIRNHRLEWHQ